jgi:hypothetical protein
LAPPKRTTKKKATRRPVRSAPVGRWVRWLVRDILSLSSLRAGRENGEERSPLLAVVL